MGTTGKSVQTSGAGQWTKPSDRKLGKVEWIQKPQYFHTGGWWVFHLLPTRFLSWNMWPWHPMQRTVTISHIGAVPEAPPHADGASLTSQTKSIESICLWTPTNPKMYIRFYPQGIKHMRVTSSKAIWECLSHRAVPLWGGVLSWSIHCWKLQSLPAWWPQP